MEPAFNSRPPFAISNKLANLLRDPLVTHYYNNYSFEQLPTHVHYELQAISNDQKTHEIYKLFHIACIFCLQKEQSIETHEQLKDAYDVMTRFIKDDLFFLPKIPLMQIPLIFYTSCAPYRLATAIIKMCNSNLFLLSNPNSLNNFRKLISFAELWFGDYKLKSKFDEISSDQFSQTLFDALTNKSKEEDINWQNKRNALHSILETPYPTESKRILQFGFQRKPRSQTEDNTVSTKRPEKVRIRTFSGPG
jgi:hypothetical protein